ncbi:hypothetical protein HBI20_222090 [Parastagonospora nodorum]|nr:hypothetical protein HBI20_222090 [Parastagonospora nodorum]
MSAEAAESYRGAVCLPFSDISSTTQSRTAVVALLIAMVSLGYCHRWWRRQQPRANGLVRSIAQIAAWAAIAAVCMMTILYIGFRFVTDTPWEPSILPAEKVYIAYEPYPTLLPVTCPERRSTCNPPAVFLGMEWDIRLRSLENKSHFWDAKSYKQPEWAQVANDLSVAGQYDHQVLVQLDLASKAVKERDTTISLHMHRAQNDLERLEWSRRVVSDVAVGYATPNQTSTRILCDFLSDTGNTQEHFLTHTTLPELEQSLYRQQNGTLQTLTHTGLTWGLSNPWFEFSDPAMRSLTIKLKELSYRRFQQGSSHAKDFQKYKAMERDALQQIRRQESTVCERAHKEEAGEKEEVPVVKIGLRVMDISDMIWGIGGVVRKGAMHVPASVNRNSHYWW